MISRVALENWKSHYKSEFEFGRGTNVLVGVSGSGKTSVMDAICFALYGTFPLANSKTVKLEEVIMQKPSKQENAKVTIEFEYNNKKFEVTRTIKKNVSNEATLKENGILIAGPKPNEVTKRIQEIIDVNYDLFTRAIYSEQNQTDYFIKLNPAQRKEKIDDLLLINRYETVRSNAVSMQNRIKKQLEDKKSILKDLKENFDEKELESLQKKISEKKQRIENAQKEKNILSEKLKKTNETVSELEKKEKEAEFFRELLIKSEAKQSELKKTILETKNILKEKKPEQLQLLQKELENKKEELEKELKELFQKERETQKQADETLQKKGSLKENILQKEKQLSELKKAKSNCPVCNRKLEEHLKGELENEVLKEKNGFEKKLAEIENALKELQEKNTEQKKLVEQNNEKKLLLRESIIKTEENMRRAKELEQKEQQFANLSAEIQKILEQTKKTDFSPQKLKEQKNEQLELREKVFELEQLAKSEAEIIEQVKQNEKRFLETKKQINDFEQNCATISELIQQVTIFVNTLKETQAELRYSLINTVNEAMNDIWQAIYPYQDLESAKIEINELGNYEIMVKEKNGSWSRVDGILSGGERSCVALTIRIAVSLVLTQNLSWLILDEPTHNLDANTVSRLSLMMKNHLPELVEQVFIITHDKEMELAANSSLYTLEREKDSNSPTKPVLQENR